MATRSRPPVAPLATEYSPGANASAGRSGRLIALEALLLVVALPLALIVHAVRQALPGDIGVAKAVQTLLPIHWLSSPLQEMSVLGWPQYQTIVLVVILGALLLMRRRLGALCTALFVACADGTSYLANNIIQRPRPHAPGLFVDRQITNYFSFPSGHVVHFTLVCGFLVYLSLQPRSVPAWLKALRVFLVAWLVLMGVSRVLTGEHWPSDVLEGYLVGAFWLLIAAHAYRWVRQRWPRVAGHAEHADLQAA